jgi:hypothetical protein
MDRNDTFWQSPPLWQGCQMVHVFSNQKSQFGKILEGRFWYIMAIWYILLLLGTFYSHLIQGCLMVYVQTQNPNLGKFWRVLRWKMLVHLMVILYIFPVLVCRTKKNLAILLSGPIDVTVDLR